jgi:hypothetical protein
MEQRRCYTGRCVVLATDVACFVRWRSASFGGCCGGVGLFVFTKKVCDILRVESAHRKWHGLNLLLKPLTL